MLTYLSAPTAFAALYDEIQGIFYCTTKNAKQCERDSMCQKKIKQCWVNRHVSWFDHVLRAFIVFSYHTWLNGHSPEVADTENHRMTVTRRIIISVRVLWCKLLQSGLIAALCYSTDCVYVRARVCVSVASSIYNVHDHTFPLVRASDNRPDPCPCRMS